MVTKGFCHHLHTMDGGERPSITIRILERLLKLIRITNVFLLTIFWASLHLWIFWICYRISRGMGGYKCLSCYCKEHNICRKEVIRCRTRDKSENSVAHRRRDGIHPGLETQCKTGVSVAQKVHENSFLLLPRNTCLQHTIFPFSWLMKIVKIVLIICLG